MKVGQAGKTWFYVLKAERDLPTAERTVFELKPLTVNDNAALLDVESNAGIGSAIMARVRLGVVGWLNLRDESGAEVLFKADAENMVKPEILDHLVAAPGGFSALIELSNAIRNHSTWTEGEEKNSSSPHSSSPEN